MICLSREPCPLLGEPRESRSSGSQGAKCLFFFLVCGEQWGREMRCGGGWYNERASQAEPPSRREDRRGWEHLFIMKAGGWCPKWAVPPWLLPLFDRNGVLRQETQDGATPRAVITVCSHLRAAVRIGRRLWLAYRWDGRAGCACISCSKAIVSPYWPARACPLPPIPCSQRLAPLLQSPTLHNLYIYALCTYRQAGTGESRAPLGGNG